MAEVKHTPGPKADVLIKLTNPESGYESETAAKVTASEWHVIDRVICGSGHLYAAAPDLFEALREAKGLADMAEMYDGPGEPSEDQRQLIALRAKIDAALSKATAQQEGR